jgi:hypothetical protein
MKLILIKKSYRGGTIEHNMLLGDELDEEEIGNAVFKWCEEDPNGMEDGFRCEWEEVNDPTLKIEVIRKEIMSANNRISFMEQRRSNLITGLLGARREFERENKDGM